MLFDYPLSSQLGLYRPQIQWTGTRPPPLLHKADLFLSSPARLLPPVRFRGVFVQRTIGHRSLRNPRDPFSGCPTFFGSPSPDSTLFSAPPPSPGESLLFLPLIHGPDH